MVSTRRAKLPLTPWGCLPPQMRVLLITGDRRRGGWLADALAADTASEVTLEQAVGLSDGMARLRDAGYDVVLISHEPKELDALELLDAVRTGSSPTQPIIVLGDESEGSMTALCFEAGADAYVCTDTATTRTLIWQIARVAERARLIFENRRLSQAHRHRLQLEHDEANRLLAQQRALVEGLEDLHLRSRGCSEAATDQGTRPALALGANLPDELTEHYRELLRAYVIMGAGRLADEMNDLADLLVSSGVTAQLAMHLHLKVLEEMVQDLGARSARHVMNRGDLLIMEVMINLAEGYRRRALRQTGQSDPAVSAALDLDRVAV